MNQRRLFSILATIAVLGGSLAAGLVGRTDAQVEGPGNAPASPPGLNYRPACPGPVPEGTARCHLQIRTDIEAQARDAQGRLITSGPRGGYFPADLYQAYLPELPPPSSGGTRPPWSPNEQTVAIVDAFDHPKAENDLEVYRRQFNLPPCTTSNGCFRKVNQLGQAGSYPRFNAGWANEMALDIEMVSAICPNCKILLVEANDNSFTNLAAAVDTAARLGATAINNSYGGSEWSGETPGPESHYNHSGIAITASSGDNGYPHEWFPAVSQYVTAVGGTSLSRNTATPRGWSETAWRGAGSGCSVYISKPSWQTDAGCARRTVADVSAVADPNTGVAAYSSYACFGFFACWGVVGGTSVSAPIIASVYALAGNTGINVAPPANAASCSNGGSGGCYPYSHTPSLNDVSGGSNGSCGGSYLCTAVPGYDGPTGLGTPHDTGGF